MWNALFPHKNFYLLDFFNFSRITFSLLFHIFPMNCFLFVGYLNNQCVFLWTWFSDSDLIIFIFISVFMKGGTDQWVGQRLFMEIRFTGIWTAVNDGPEHSEQETCRDDNSHGHSGRPLPRSVWTCRWIIIINHHFSLNPGKSVPLNPLINYNTCTNWIIWILQRVKR